MGKIKLDNVNYRYSDKTAWVLKDINLRIYPKQVIAIVGRSGCGKTTLANLIAGALKPTTGRIYFDDFDTNFLSLNNLRQQIGYIMQATDFSLAASERILLFVISRQVINRYQQWQHKQVQIL